MCKILVVDDDEGMAELMPIVFNEHHVAVVRSGEEALSFLSEMVPDVALVDLGLPGQSGFEIARAIRRKHPEVHLIAITGYPRNMVESHALEAGFAKVLYKPTSLEQLVKTVTRIEIETLTMEGMGT